MALNANSAVGNAAFSSTSPNMSWSIQGGAGSVTTSSGTTKVSLPALSWSVFSANGTVNKAKKLTTVVTTVVPDSEDSDQIEINATAQGAPFIDITFKYRIGKGKWVSLGVDSAPTFSLNSKESGRYRVFPLVTSFPKKTSVQFESVATDSYGVTAVSVVKTFKTK